MSANLNPIEINFCIIIDYVHEMTQCAIRVRTDSDGPAPHICAKYAFLGYYWPYSHFRHLKWPSYENEATNVIYLAECEMVHCWLGCCVIFAPRDSGTALERNVGFEALAIQMNALQYGIINAHQTQPKMAIWRHKSPTSWESPITTAL